jgi:hypothetical protein
VRDFDDEAWEEDGLEIDDLRESEHDVDVPPHLEATFGYIGVLLGMVRAHGDTPKNTKVEFIAVGSDRPGPHGVSLKAGDIMVTVARPDCDRRATYFLHKGQFPLSRRTLSALAQDLILQSIAYRELVCPCN